LFFIVKVFSEKIIPDLSAGLLATLPAAFSLLH
jgi:hypothetical protein